MPGLRIHSLDGADHLRPEQDVVRRNHLAKQANAGEMVYARVEVHVAQQVLQQRGLAQILCESSIAAPMIRDRSPAVRNDEAQSWEIPEQIALDELHERSGIAVDVVGSGSMKIRIAGARNVDHRGYVELAQLLVQRIPVPID